MKNIAIITGASSGFGELFALQLDTKLKTIDEFWLVARNTEKMVEISKAMKTPCRILSLDLAETKNVKELIKAVEREADDCEDDLYIKMLINCAGYGKIGNFITIEEDDVVGMIDVNVKALTLITRGLIPYMATNGRIINVASVAAFLPQPGFAEYAATKAYVLSLSRALNAELKARKISVMSLCPGPSATNFFNIAETTGKTPWYKKFFLSDPEKVVNKAIHDSINRYEVSVYSLSMRAFRVFSKIVPHNIILRFFKH